MMSLNGLKQEEECILPHLYATFLLTNNSISNSKQLNHNSNNSKTSNNSNVNSNVNKINNNFYKNQKSKSKQQQIKNYNEMSSPSSSFDFHNIDNDTNNDEYVFVEFDKDEIMMDDQYIGDDTEDNEEYNDNEEEDDFMDDESYDQCDVLSLSPSITASVCSETMFGDSGPTINNNDVHSNMTENLKNDNGGGKPRSCSIVSLYEEEVEGGIQMKTHDDDDANKMMARLNHSSMDIDLPIVNNNNEKPKYESKKKSKNDSKKNDTAAAAAGTTSPSTTSTSRLSNKKRRKKMKQLKKSAALAQFTAAMKEKSSSIHSLIASSSPSSPSFPTKTTPVISMKQSSKRGTVVAVNKSGSSNIAVICAREALLDYKQTLKAELDMKKKTNGTLNF